MHSEYGQTEFHHCQQWIFVLLFLLSGAFPALSKNEEVFVVSDSFTSWIVLRNSNGTCETYEFAQKHWYLDVVQGVRGGLSTALPAEAVVIRGQLRRLPSQTYGRNSYFWSIPADSAQITKLRNWLDQRYDASREYRTNDDDVWEIVPVEIDRMHAEGWSYHPTTLRYSIWWNCHDYVLTALREAGILSVPKPSLVVNAKALAAVLTLRYGPPKAVP